MKETTFEEQSSLKIYSLGIVIKNEKPDAGEILVSPIETMNVQEPGIIALNKIEFSGSHPDDKGIAVSGNVKAENYVKAKWISLGGSNRATAPNVYPNETVLLFRYSNNDVFYWTSIFHEPKLRKKESASFGFSNMSVTKGWSNGSPVEFNKDTGYWIEVDAIKKLVSLTTPDNDGEFAKYTFEIDVKKSSLTISDNKNNVIKINSKKGIEVTSDLSVLVKGKGNVDIESDKVITLRAPKVVVNGDLSVTGSLSGNGLKISGNASISGTLTAGSVTTSKVKEGASAPNLSSVTGSSVSGSGGGSSTSINGSSSTGGGLAGQSSSGSGGFSPSSGSSSGSDSGGFDSQVISGGKVRDYIYNTDAVITPLPTGGFSNTYNGPASFNSNGDLVHDGTGLIIQTAADREKQTEQYYKNDSTPSSSAAAIDNITSTLKGS